MSLRDYYARESMQPRPQGLRGKLNPSVQYVAQYPDGTSIRTLKTKTQFLRRPF